MSQIAVRQQANDETVYHLSLADDRTGQTGLDFQDLILGDHCHVSWPNAGNRPAPPGSDTGRMS